MDLIALLAMGGALALEEYLAGAVIAFMLATGRTLEDFADARAHRELSALIERAPRSAHRYEDGSLTSVPIGEVRAGDLLLVKHGEVVPVDGLLVSGIGVLDESALTGESLPRRTQRGRAGAFGRGQRRRGRSTCGRSRAPTGARTPASFGWSSRRRGRRRRSSAWPTGTR